MAKTKEKLTDKTSLISVPSRTARVRRTRGTPEKIQQTHIIRQAKG